ncbi:MAG TPA: glycosyltransferase [Solirubrobacteraceae bacterium]|nr:glycosyltransferase [Solirubrobacteraceae bacterium]
MARVLFVAPRPSSFIELDRTLLAERHDVRPLYGNRPQRDLRGLGRAVRAADVVFGWWAHLHTLFPFTLARRLRTPTVLIVGGFDVADLPDIAYGSQRGGWRRVVSRRVMARADVLATNSHYSVAELQQNVGIPPERVTVIHHGVPDPFGADPVGPDRAALTVGNVDRVNLERKGLRPFVLAAAELPDVRFAVVGRHLDGAADALRAIAPPNVELTGFLEKGDLDARLRRAAVYVQASQHEGFGVSAAEAMLAGAVPVVTAAGALPEVVGDAGIVIDRADTATLAAGIRAALGAGPERRRAARERVLREFSVDQRRRGLLALVERALAGPSAS